MGRGVARPERCSSLCHPEPAVASRQGEKKPKKGTFAPAVQAIRTAPHPEYPPKRISSSPSKTQGELDADQGQKC